MKFTCNTKPLADGLELGIITSNITKFYQKSCIVELTILENSLRINTEASALKAELTFKGNVEGEGNSHIFVDSLLLKNLIKTIESDTIQFEIKPDSLTIHSGKSKFNLPQVVSGDDLELSRPQAVNVSSSESEINKSGWEFIKDQQMYAIAMSFIHPVYTNVWIGDSGDVIVGDFDNSIFTHSSKVNFDTTCLITDTIVNLLTTVPESSKIISLGRSYEVLVETDPYTYLCEFTPKYEDDEGVGDYSSNLILSLFEKSEDAFEVDSTMIAKCISQAELFTITNDDTINLSVTSDSFKLYNENVDFTVPVICNCDPFEIEFKISLLKDVVSHMDDAKIKVQPLIQEGEATGIVLWTDSMEAVLAGKE